MSKRDKRLARIRARPVEADVEDIWWVLEEFGWVRRNSEGSHFIYEKPGAGEYPISVPAKGGQKVKRRYIDMICERLGLDE